MSIPFALTPAVNFSPGVYTEVDYSGLPSGAAARAVVLMGYGPPGLAALDGPDLAQEVESPETQIDQMVAAFRRVNPTATLYRLAVPPPAAGVAADTDLIFTGPATEAGTIYLYLGDHVVQVPIADGDTDADMATAASVAINAASIGMSASPTAGVTTITDDLAASEGNRRHVAVNPLASQKMPAGVTAVFDGATFSGGTGTPDDINEALDALSAIDFHTLVSGFSDATSLAAVAAEADRRWDPTVELEGVAFFGAEGADASMIAEADAVQSEYVVCAPAGQSLTPPWVAACLFAGREAQKSDPAVGQLGVSLSGMLPPALADQWGKADRDTLLAGGVSTFRVVGSTVVIDRIVTTRTEDDLGGTSYARHAIQTIRTLQFLREDWRQLAATKFANKKLADSPDIPPGTPGIVTPETIELEAIAWFKRVRDVLGLVQDLDAFKASLHAEVNGSDPNRIDIFLPPKLIRPLITVATLIQPR